MHMYENTLSAFPTEPIDESFMKLGRDEVLMVPYKCCFFFGQIRPGADPGRGKNRSRGPSSTNFFRRLEGCNDLEACGMKCYNFWFLSKVKYLMRFWCLFGLSIALWCFGRIYPGVDPGWGKNRSRGSLSSKNFFRPEGYSNKPNA